MQVESSTPQPPRIEVPTCPQCNSLFITEEECEGCGYQFRVDRLGEPYGIRSFTNMFPYERDPWFWLSPGRKEKDAKEKRRYQRKLLFRLEILLEYFFAPIEDDLERRKHFLLECREIVTELVELGTSSDSLLRLFEDQPEHGTFQAISGFVLQAERDVRSRPGFLKRVWDWRAFGIIGLPLLIRMGILFIPVIAASYFFMNYVLVGSF